MVLGNAMTHVSLGPIALQTTLYRECRAIEAYLLERTSVASVFPALRSALRIVFTPIIKGMATVGVVSLPGTMAGHVLSGVDP